MSPPADASFAAPLFRPFGCGSLRLRNRIVMAPMTRSFSPGGVPGPDVAAYYRRRAENGVGLIITEGCWIPHPLAANNPDVPRLYGDDALAQWRPVVHGVHSADARIVAQLWHTGLIRRASGDGTASAAPASTLGLGPSGKLGGVGAPLVATDRTMTECDIADVIAAFAVAARNAQNLGFDGVELHGAHGYLIDQFLWRRTNCRIDRYGGSPAARASFAAEVVAAVRDATGPAFPILFRLSQWKLQDYDAQIAMTPQELSQLLAPLVDAGVDLFDCSQRRFWEPTFAGSNLNLAGWVRNLTGRPTVTVGSVGLDGEFMASLLDREKADPAGISRLLAMLERGEFDLVAVGRALLVDPEWPSKIRAGHIEDLRAYTPAALATLT